jgi:hypothetical protein
MLNQFSYLKIEQVSYEENINLGVEKSIRTSGSHTRVFIFNYNIIIKKSYFNIFFVQLTPTEDFPNVFI